MELLTVGQFKKAVSYIKKSGKTLDDKIQSAALFAIDQVNSHGQTTPMNQLVGALGKSARKEALKTFLRDHSKVAFNDKNLAEYRKNKKLFKMVDSTRIEITIEEALENAASIHFADYTVESTPPSKTDALARFKATLDRLGKFKGTIEHKDLIKQIKDVVEAYEHPKVPELVR